MTMLKNNVEHRSLTSRCKLENVSGFVNLRPKIYNIGFVNLRLKIYNVGSVIFLVIKLVYNLNLSFRKQPDIRDLASILIKY